jgi:hypothetical protein
MVRSEGVRTERQASLRSGIDRRAAPLTDQQPIRPLVARTLDEVLDLVFKVFSDDTVGWVEG